MVENGYVTRGRRRRRPRRSRSTSTRARSARSSLRRRATSPRRCAASSPSATARRSSTRAASRSAPRSTRSCSRSARKALTDGLVRYRRGARLARRRSRTDRLARRLGRGARRRAARSATSSPGSSPWCSTPARPRPTIGLQPPREQVRRRCARPRTGTIGLDGVRWAKWAEGPQRGRAVQGRPGAEVGRRRSMSSRSRGLGSSTACARSRRSPARMVAMDPYTGRVLAHGRRLLLRPVRVQPRHAGAAPAGLVLQAVRLRGGARQRLHAVLGRARRADRDRPGRRPRRLAAGELRQQVLRAADAALRHRAFAQRHDRAPRAGHGHAADRRIRQALRHL